MSRSGSSRQAIAFWLAASFGCLVFPTLALAQSAPAAGATASSAAATADRQASQPQKPAAADQAAKPGQQPDEAQPPRLDVNVVVTAPRVDIPIKDNPAATSIVDETMLGSMPRAVGADEALWLVPGVKVDNQADGERVHLSIRGQGLLTERGIRGVKVLLDGLPLNDPTGFAPDLFDVDWSSVRRVEVLRGSASALYGGGSSGGVINITTRDGGPGSVTGMASIDAGSYGFYKPFAEAGGTAGRLNYHVTASGNAGDGYRVHTKFDAFNLYGKARLEASDTTRLTFVLAGTHFYNDNAEGLNLDWLAEDRRLANPDALTFNEGQRTNRFTAGMSGRTKWAVDRELSYAVYYRRTGWWESVPSSVQHRTYDSPGGNLQFTMDGDVDPWTNHLTVGADFDAQFIGEFRNPNLGNAVEGSPRLSDQSIVQRGVGVYAIDRLEFSPQWSGTLGLRFDQIHNELTDHLQAGGVDLSGSASFSKFTGRVGAAYNPKPDLGLYASWGQGFLPPATEELANNPDAQGGFNRNLVPAASQGEELGVRGSHGGVAYDVGFFHLSTNNDFGRYRVRTRPLETFYGNLGKSRRYGLETALTWSPVSGSLVRAAYTYNDFLYTNVQSLFGSFTDKVMPNAPTHQLSLDGEYTRARLTVGLGVFAQSGWFVDQTNAASVDGYVLVNPRVSYRLASRPYRADLVLQVRNLLGAEYIAFTEPDPDGNSYQPAPTREIFVGLRVRLGG